MGKILCPHIERERDNLLGAFGGKKGGEKVFCRNFLAPRVWETKEGPVGETVMKSG